MGVTISAQRHQILKTMMNHHSLLAKVLSKIVDIRAEQLTDKAISWLKKGDFKKFFLWIHYMDVHHPYMPPWDYVKRFSSKNFSSWRMLMLYKKLNENRKLLRNEQESLIDLYDASIKYLDNNIWLLVNQLDLSNTLIFLTSDHGDLLGEHGLYYHGPPLVFMEQVSSPIRYSK